MTAVIPPKRIITVITDAKHIIIPAAASIRPQAIGRASPRRRRPEGADVDRGSAASLRSDMAADSSGSARWRSGRWSEPS
jgi:hypothetical protein